MKLQKCIGEPVNVPQLHRRELLLFFFRERDPQTCLPLIMAYGSSGVNSIKLSIHMLLFFLVPAFTHSLIRVKKNKKSPNLWAVLPRDVYFAFSNGLYFTVSLSSWKHHDKDNKGVGAELVGGLGENAHEFEGGEGAFDGGILDDDGDDARMDGDAMVDVGKVWCCWKSKAL
ncbi:hypothetical protein VNO78_19390 [Psophocarpus tetragonolobus]|uniref:Uncharacterized protein n=1 Tax=Psophocarpus tetragonolobus TaxID=3891 RepID=A0AAN9S8P4_PSOTE